MIDENMKIAIIGGTGKAGRSLVRRALLDGYHVRMLVRNPDKLSFSNDHIEIVKGDARDIKAIVSVLEGCDFVISALGQPKKESPIFSTATSHIISSIQENHIKRYVLITGMGVDIPGDKKNIISIFSSKIMHLLFPSIMSDKQKEVGILLESQIDWTLVRLPYIKEGPATGKIKVSLEHPLGKSISSEDLAQFLIKQIIDNRYVKRAPFVSN